jgi:PAS domain S-box-containing protein
MESDKPNNLIKKINNDVNKYSCLADYAQHTDEWFRALADTIPTMVWIAGTDKSCYYFNKVWLDFRGKTLEQEAGDGWMEGIHPDDMEPCMHAFTIFFEQRVKYELEYRIRRYDGQYRYLLETGVPNYDKNNTFIGYIGTCYDITERKEAEERLIRNEYLLHEIYENSADALLIVDPESEIVENCNLKAVEMFGYNSKSEIIGRSNVEINKQVLKLEDIRMIDDHVKIHKSWSGDVKFSRVDQQEFWGSLAVTSLNINKRKLYLIRITNIDTQKKIEEAINKQKEYLREIIDAVPNLIFIKDKESRMLLANKAVSELGGRPIAELINSNEWTKYVKPEELEQFLQSDMEVIQQHKTVVVEDQSTNPYTGRTTYFLTTKKPFIQADGTVTVLGVSVDITEQKEVQQQLKASVHEKEVLIKEIHHRVKNNMAIISSLLTMQSYYLQDERLSDALKTSQSRIKSMALIHDQLYKSEILSKIEFGRYLKVLASNLQSSYATADKSIYVNVEAEEVFFDITTAVPCGLLVNELITNAYKHAFEGRTTGRIDVNFTQQDSVSTIQVADNGIGLPADLDLTNSASLGLTLVHELVIQIKANMKIETAHGTTFTITFNNANV